MENRNAKNEPIFKNINGYAVNGAVHYANAVLHHTAYTDIIAIGITGHRDENTGEFHYGRNFYAKDADALNILLPEQDSQPDYGFMQTLLCAVQKTVIKNVVAYADRKTAATESVIRRNNQSRQHSAQKAV